MLVDVAESSVIPGRAVSYLVHSSLQVLLLLSHILSKHLVSLILGWRSVLEQLLDHFSHLLACQLFIMFTG